MKITIKGTEKEIADLVVLLQNQRLVRKPYSDKFTVGAVEDKPATWRRFELINNSQEVALNELCERKDLSREDLMLICSTIRLKDDHMEIIEGE